MIAALLLVSQLAFANDNGYEIGAGDVVEIKVHRVEIGETTFKVSEGGEISYPYVGRVKLVGLTTFEAEEHMISVLKDGYIANPEVTVKVTNHEGHPVAVIGSVKKPGTYALSGTTTLRDLMSQAGGIAEGTIIEVNRGGTIITVGGSTLDGAPGDTLVEGGDVISVIASEKIYMSGEVENEGSIPFRKNLTASQALIESGGPTQYARLSASYIVRNNEKIKLNFKKILSGKHSDVPLKPGDRIVIPTSVL